MNITQPTPIVRLLAATLVAVTTIGLSALAMHTPDQTQSPITLNNIQTDKAATFYAAQHPTCAWFVEAVLPTSEKLVDQRPSCAWFVEAVFPTGDDKLMTENLKSVAATL